jgi:hypothetical protein
MLCSEDVAIFGRWFLIVASMFECEEAIHVVLSTLIVTLMAAIILFRSFVFR